MSKGWRFWCRIFFGCLPLVVFWGAEAGAAVAAEASVQRSSMPLGQTNVYTITIRDITHIPQLDPPDVTGLTFSRTPSAHSSASIINGSAAMETTLSWMFQGEQVGRYVIPERVIDVRGQRLRVNAVTVEVTEMSAEMRSRFFLSWDVPDDPFYVGQAIPATLQLYVRGGINAGLGSRPEGSDDRFIRTEFPDEPRQRQEQVNGQPFVVVEWDTVLTPIRSGRASLSASLVLVYETGQTRRDLFGPRAVQDQVRLTTGATEWEIRDLPRADRPASFTGAVGRFEVEARLSAREAETGEPLTLVLEVRGEGNFGRIRAPEIPETDGWRIYPPRSQMKQEDVPFRGVKSFEYIVTPTHASVEEAPPVAFSWFDPQRREWQEEVLGPEPVRVRPGASMGSGRTAAGTGASAAEPAGGDTIRPMAHTFGRSRSLAPPWRQPSFWFFNGGMGLLAAFMLIGIARQRKTAQNPYLRVRSQATRQASDLAGRAMKAAAAQDVSGFYLHATRSLRQFIAVLDPGARNAESLTWHELDGILQQSSFDETARERLRLLFDRQEAHHFAGWKPTGDELQKDRESFESLLNQIASHQR